MIIVILIIVIVVYWCFYNKNKGINVVTYNCLSQCSVVHCTEYNSMLHCISVRGQHTTCFSNVIVCFRQTQK